MTTIKKTVTESEVMVAVEKVLEETSYDFAHWYDYDFDTETAILEEDLYKDEVSDGDIEDNKNDFIYSIINDVISAVCEDLGIEKDKDSCDTCGVDLFEVTREILRKKLEFQSKKKLITSFEESVKKHGGFEQNGWLNLTESKDYTPEVIAGQYLKNGMDEKEYLKEHDLLLEDILNGKCFNEEKQVYLLLKRAR